MMTQLEARIRKAIEKMSREGITGWGLSVPAGMPGEVVAVSEPYGCNSDTCNHVSHDPAAADYRWLPPEGSQLTFLGYDGTEAYYHVLLPGGEEMFLCHEDRQYYHDFLYEVDAEDVPDHVLWRFARRGDEDE